jgi:hypothetical protein
VDELTIAKLAAATDVPEPPFGDEKIVNIKLRKIDVTGKCEHVL